MSESRWRTLARRAIKAALNSLPDDATEKQIRRAIFDAYPFGTRELLPYKHWLTEQKAALKKLGISGKAKVKDKTDAVIAYHVHKQPSGRLWMEVTCGWCADKVVGGCLMCVSYHHRMRTAVGDKEFLALRDAAEDGDEVARCALGDWLEENLGTRCGL